uniref:Uncharacterized protein n=1 Tax=viral metagenome TaxID=1070528 RepID=A0A6M3LG88_9ZZZZ
MTITELSALVHKTGLVNFYRPGRNEPSKIAVAVEIKDVRPGQFGRTDCLISPLAGEGEEWVSLDRIKLEEWEKEE